MTEERLAKRYRTLLTFYPRAYRQERGEELVGTLLECARPGQSWPRWREARALLLEGLRMRAGTGGRRPARTVLLDGLQLTVLLLIAMWALGFATEALRYDFGPQGNGRLVAAQVLAFGLVPFVLVALGRFAWSLPFLVVGAVAWMPWFKLGDEANYYLYQLVAVSAVTLVAAVVLWWKQPMGWRAGAAVVMFAVGVPLLHDLPTWLMEFGFDNDPDILWYPQALLFVLIYLGAVVYAVVDPRPAMAMAAYVFVEFVGDLAQSLRLLATMPGFTPDPTLFILYALLLVIPGAAAAAAWVGVRRQAAAEPLKIGQ